MKPRREGKRGGVLASGAGVVVDVVVITVALVVVGFGCAERSRLARARAFVA